MNEISMPKVISANIALIISKADIKLSLIMILRGMNKYVSSATKLQLWFTEDVCQKTKSAGKPQLQERPEEDE